MMTLWNKIKQIDFQKIKAFFKYIHEEYIKYPTYILLHPLKGFDQFKREKRAKMSVAITFIVILIILEILSYEYTGFIVNPYDVQNLNTVMEVFYVVIPIIFIVVANWSVTTLFDGKGKMKEIFMMICYSLFPLICAKMVGMMFSNIIVTAEVGLYYLIISIGSFLLGYMVFFGFISIHEYGLFKCILSIGGTIIAILILFFVVLLCFDLFQKMYGFLYTVYREITLRYM